MDRPSISADMLVVRSWNDLAAARSSASVVPFPSTVEASALAMGKNKASPAGTLQWRSAKAMTSPPLVTEGAKEAPRNHTFPDWPALQSAVSKRGWWSTGSEKAHCHQEADHSP